MDVQGYRWVPWRVWLCRLGTLLSFGLLLILFHWWPRLAVVSRCCLCPLALADVVLIRVSVSEVKANFTVASKLISSANTHTISYSGVKKYVPSVVAFLFHVSHQRCSA
ncbi:hypothetical protein GOODEAATRI_028645 [Goodea atripinnis]|uniref:Cation-transporting ATPase n=1 Tax=Goodea atripinnis TaxID=208336 RepID=A0ABV0PHV7_9TELE